MLTRKRHDGFELEQGDAWVVGIAAPPGVEQAQNSHAAVGFAIHANGEVFALEQFDRLRAVILVERVVGAPQFRVGKSIEGLIEQHEALGVAGFRVVGMIALGQHLEDPVNRLRLGVRADLQELVIIDKAGFGHIGCHLFLDDTLPAVNGGDTACSA